MTAALAEPYPFDDDLDLDELEDQHDDELEAEQPPPTPTRRQTTQQRARADLTTRHTATQAALLELVADALAAKVAHDVDAHPLALDALDRFTATAQRLRAAVDEEQHAARALEETNA